MERHGSKENLRGQITEQLLRTKLLLFISEVLPQPHSRVKPVIPEMTLTGPDTLTGLVVYKVLFLLIISLGRHNRLRKAFFFLMGSTKWSKAAGPRSQN